jgi:hypothetical protein
LSLKIKVVEGFWFGHQNQQLWFGDLSLKITATVFLVWTSKPGGLRFIGYTTKPMEGDQRGTRVEI